MISDYFKVYNAWKSQLIVYLTYNIVCCMTLYDV